jgi:pSer/pThr/pTyr-binding forkhead associated (FHA) protein
MSELTLFILRLVFLALLWVFVFAIIYALRSDLFGQRARKLPDTAAVATFPSPAASAPTIQKPQSTPATTSPAIAKRLVITGGAKEGLEVTLPRELLTIGRAGESGLVIRDDYTSTHHARLVPTSAGWTIEDLDSTNGTFLDGTRVNGSKPVPLNTPVTIGTTTFELRR